MSLPGESSPRIFNVTFYSLLGVSVTEVVTEEKGPKQEPFYSLLGVSNYNKINGNKRKLCILSTPFWEFRW
ncbi:MAG: hypothetical protein QW162_07605, partial [Ignisphaera sp.]